MPQAYHFFMHMNATKEWLTLSRQERRSFFDHLRSSIFDKYPHVSVRFFDVEAFSARCSDIALFATDQIQDYYYLIEELRDSKVYTVPYFEIVEILPAIEDGFSDFEDNQSDE
jgi:hypothetical protein